MTEKRIISTDSESHMFGVGNMAPKPVCYSWAEGDDVGLVTGDDIPRLLKLMLKLAAQRRALITGFAVSYDFGSAIKNYPALASLIFKAYALDGVVDTRLVEKLLDIADGRHNRWGGKAPYSLEAVARRRLKLEMAKGADTWRRRYGELDGVPLKKWPKEAISYSLDDAKVPLQLLHDQHARAAKLKYDLPDAFDQTRADLALRLISMRGTRTDAKRRRKLVAKLTRKMMKLVKGPKGLIKMGLYAFDKNGKGTKSTTKLKELVTEAFGGAPPMTAPSKRFPNGQVKTDGDTLEDLYEVSPRLKKWVKFCALEKDLGFAKKLKPLMHNSYNALVDTGRTSSFGEKPPTKKAIKEGTALPEIPGCNIQQLPRDGDVRGCFKARKGFVLCTSDYDSQELRTLAQTLLLIVGNSKLAERYQADPTFDPHTSFAAAELLHMSEAKALRLKKADDAEVLKARQSAKICNFGLPGGMGIRGLIKYARGYGERWAEPLTCKGCAPGADYRVPHTCRSQDLKTAWLRQWPEMPYYFRFVKSLAGHHGGTGTLEQLISGRLRGGVGFTDGANSFFQGLAADASKRALWEVMRRCHDPSMKSPLYGAYGWAFIHDEIILEVREEQAHEVAVELPKVMIRAMERYTPDIPVRASAALMRYWKKGAKPAYNKKGIMIPVEDAVTA